VGTLTAMRWLVAGAQGMLGVDVVRRLADRPRDDVRALGRGELDVTDSDACIDAVRGRDVVVNCAAYTAVDAAESDEAAAFAVNAVGAAHLARAARRAGARIVYISTDYVFNGDALSAWPEDAPVAPRSAYGRTKAAGEWATRAENPDHVVLRTAWLYGAHGRCFPSTIAAAAAERGALQVVNDQVGQPTWTADVADLLIRLVDAGAPVGTYHGTARGETSWFGFARAVVASAGLDPGIVAPTTTDAFPRPAPRPGYSVLGHDAVRAAGLVPIGDWRRRWEQAASSVLRAIRDELPR